MRTNHNFSIKLRFGLKWSSFIGCSHDWLLLIRSHRLEVLITLKMRIVLQPLDNFIEVCITLNLLRELFNNLSIDLESSNRQHEFALYNIKLTFILFVNLSQAVFKSDDLIAHGFPLLLK